MSLTFFTGMKNEFTGMHQRTHHMMANFPTHIVSKALKLKMHCDSDNVGLAASFEGHSTPSPFSN